MLQIFYIITLITTSCHILSFYLVRNSKTGLRWEERIFMESGKLQSKTMYFVYSIVMRQTLLFKSFLHSLEWNILCRTLLSSGQEQVSQVCRTPACGLISSEEMMDCAEENIPVQSQLKYSLILLFIETFKTLLNSYAVQ